MNYTYQYLIRTLAHEMKRYADRKLDEYGITQEQKPYTRLSISSST